jgi:hypothetical protein
MWLLDFIPNWIFHLLLVVGVVSLGATTFLKTLIKIPNVYAVQLISAVVVLIAVWFEGGIYNEQKWNTRVAELEEKIKLAEAESAKENTKIETKVVTNLQIVKQRGEEVVKYIDREIVKYDSGCVIPREFIEAHNLSANRSLK